MTKEAFENFKEGEGSSTTKKKPKPTYEELYKEHKENKEYFEDRKQNSKINSTLCSVVFTTIVFVVFNIFATFASVTAGNLLENANPVGKALIIIFMQLGYLTIFTYIWWHLLYVTMVTTWRDELEELERRFDVYVHAGRTALREYNKNKRDEDDL